LRKRFGNVLVLLFLFVFCLILGFINAATGEKIVFVSNRDYGFTTDLNYNEIYVMDPDGYNPVRLTTNNYYDGEPCWTPEGKIVFETWRDINHEIYIMDGDGQNQQNLTNNSALDGEPSVSSDGTKIAFSSDRSGAYEIWVMNIDGTGATQLTSNGGNYQPTWSPDGTKIAYESNGDIYVMNASDGTGQVRLTDHSAQDTCPAWSPDGSKIAFGSYRDNNWEIYIMNATDGSSLTNISFSNADDFNPCWSPDGSVIMYHSFKDGRNEIYRMYTDGKLQTRITIKDGSNSSPAWLGEIFHDQWSIVCPSVAKRSTHGVVTGSDGRVYAFGVTVKPPLTL
jgi:tol-pal system beta propeller repeat protein TolB